ncbi:hypothetical protein RhiJN_10798 [Ceratobasidium sp. AG-Ba]|nr:hypothetical protein RhiJN_10798 [Ceratobasidium sp. AG-Ba]
MSDGALGRGHRIAVPTPGILEWNQTDRQSDQANQARSSRRRSNVRNEKKKEKKKAKKDGKDKTAKEKTSKDKTTKKDKQSKAQVADVPMETNSEEERNVADLKKDEERARQLQYMIMGRTGASFDELRVLDLDELEERWKKVSGEAPTNTASTIAPKAPPHVRVVVAKAPAKAPLKAPAETPAKKIRASKVFPSQVTALGSPLDALKKPESREVDSPVAQKRTRDASVDLPEQPARRSRLDTEGRLYVPHTSARSKSSAKSKSSNLRHGSRSRSVLSNLRQTDIDDTNARSSEEDDDSSSGSESSLESDLDIDSNSSSDEEEAATSKKRTKGKEKAAKDEKPRPKRSDYNRRIEGVLIDRTVELVEVAMVPNMCPPLDEFKLMIIRGWSLALKYCGYSKDEAPLTTDIIRIIKGLVSSFRARGRKRMAEMLAVHFNLVPGPGKNLDDVKDLAAGLVPTKFHRDPEAVGENAGHYRNTFVPRAIATMWFSGAKPIGMQHPEVLNPVPPESIAYVCAIAEDILERFKKDGCLEVEIKAKKGEGKGKRKKKKAGEEVVPRADPDTIKLLMSRHLDNVLAFKKDVEWVYEIHRYTLYTQAKEWAGKGGTENEKPKPVDSGIVSFSDEQDLPAEEGMRRLAALCAGSALPAVPQPRAKPCVKAPVHAPIPRPSSSLPQIPEQSESEPERFDKSPTRPSVHPKSGRMFKPFNDGLSLGTVEQQNPKTEDVCTKDLDTGRQRGSNMDSPKARGSNAHRSSSDNSSSGPSSSESSDDSTSGSSSESSDNSDSNPAKRGGKKGGNGEPAASTMGAADDRGCAGPVTDDEEDQTTTAGKFETADIGEGDGGKEADLPARHDEPAPPSTVEQPQVEDVGPHVHNNKSTPSAPSAPSANIDATDPYADISGPADEAPPPSSPLSSPQRTIPLKRMTRASASVAEKSHSNDPPADPAEQPSPGSRMSAVLEETQDGRGGKAR